MTSMLNGKMSKECYLAISSSYATFLHWHDLLIFILIVAMLNISSKL